MAMGAVTKDADGSVDEPNPCFEIILGTYEEFVLGYQVFETPAQKDGKVSIGC